jgi:hypothetical protein
MELWLPWIKIAGPIVVSIAIIWFTFRLKRPKNDWFITTSRSVGILSSLPLFGVSLFLLTAQGCEEDRRLVSSPDGKHVARLMIWGSVPSGTSVHVIERRSWSPTWQTVSEGTTIGTLIDPLEPQLSWRSNTELLIDYPATTEGTGFLCESRSLGDILISCKTHKGNKQWN